MNKKKLLSGPYLLWSVAFILIPFAMILFYGFTNSEGQFTFENVLAIGTGGKFQGALPFLDFVYNQHDYLSCFGIPIGNDAL